MSDVRLVVHGHFYQPPRENPWTGEVPIEPSAAPFHDWNDRITAECYRPNGWARVVDERGRVTQIVDNYQHLSFNVGPTLLSWLETHHVDVYERILASDQLGGGAIAQAYSHPILPLSDERDMRTQIRWGLADFEHRFGRRAQGLWLPETAVNDDVLRVLVEEGVAFTILAPTQAVAVRPIGAGDDEWVDVAGGSVEGGWPYTWRHPSGQGEIALVFYDGGISHDLAFGLSGVTSRELINRVRAAAADGSPVVIATDGETFGHHHKFADRALAYAFVHEAAEAGVAVLDTNELVATVPPRHEVRVQESAWSCAHGVGRWKEDCGCSTGGEPGWTQAWRAPLRAALDIVRNHGKEVFERRGAEMFVDAWSARDAYIDVLLGQQDVDAFLAAQMVEARRGDAAAQVVARTLLEAQHHALLMYTSCGWFFNDLAGIETVQILQYAARAIDLLAELGEADGLAEQLLDELAQAHSNRPEEGDGRAIWAHHVDPARVDADRVIAHLALVELLDGSEAPASLAGFEVVDHPHQQASRGGLRGIAGAVVLQHERTGRRSEHVYAAVHLGGLEVFGATRAADPARDPDAFARLADAASGDARVTTLLRLIADDFGPHEFGLDSALPDAADQIVDEAAAGLADRFVGVYETLYGDNRPLLGALVKAGFPLPPELRVPAELALARRFETAVAEGRFEVARAVVDEARAAGFTLVTPRAVATMSRSVLTAVEAAVADPQEGPIGDALDVLRLAHDLDLSLDIDRAQELVYEVVTGGGPGRDALAPLAEALYLSVG